MNHETPYRLSQLRWGAGFASTFDPGFPLDAVMTWMLPRGPSSIRSRAAGSVEAAWDDGRNDHFIGFRIRFVTPKPGAVPNMGPGGSYDGAGGLRHMIEAWQSCTPFRLVADRVNAPGSYITIYPTLVDSRVSIFLEADGITLSADLTARSDSPITGW